MDPVADDKAVETAPLSVVKEVPEVEPLTNKQCVAWEIDVSNWKAHGNKGSKRLGVKTTYLREKDSNNSVGGAIQVKSEETKTNLVMVMLPKLKAEVKMAQCCDDIKEKKVLDLRRW